MKEYLPLLILGATIGAFTLVFAVAYALVKDKKGSFGFDRKMSDKELIARLFKYALPEKKRFVIAAALMAVSIVYDVLSPLVVGYVEELVKGEFALPALAAYVAAFAGLLVVSVTATYFESVILQKAGQRIISALREDLFRHIEGLSHAQLYHTPVGTLVTRVANDTETLSRMFTQVLVNLAKSFFVIIGVLAAMFALSYILTLTVLCFVPFVVFFTVIFRKFSRRAYRASKDATTDVNIFLSENLSGMKKIRVFNREEAKRGEFAAKNEKLGKAILREIFVFGVFRPVVYLLYIGSVLCLFYLGGKGFLGGATIGGQAVSAGVIISFYMYIEKFFNPIQNLAEQFNTLQSALASAEKIFTVLDVAPGITDAEDAVELTEVRGDVEFRDVWFAYKDEEWILKGVSFKVSAGETVAFVGATGAGKSTILSLICRNYDAQRGTITVDGVDVKKIKISSLRKHFGQMPQDVFLFSGTVRSNIVLHEEKTDEEIMRACAFVNADKFIAKLPRGLDEEVLERSNNFSAGERQLLSFARMIVHSPEVMILDEATANIDAETELLIQESLERLMAHGTMLVVAHRLSTVRNADRIIVLSGGKIVEEGSHARLMEKRGAYYELYTVQTEKTLLKGSE